MNEAIEAPTAAQIPTDRAPRPEPAQPHPPTHLWLTILHLAAFGALGLATIGTLVGVFGAGVGLLFALGVGVFVLAGLVYALFGVAWFEVERVSGLYRLDAPPLALRRAPVPGFGAWLRAIARQSVDGRMWRALASFTLASLAGAVMLWLARGLIQGLSDLVGWMIAGRAFTAPLGEWVPGLVFVIVCPAGIFGLALLHRAISTAIIGAGAREAALEDRARTSAAQRAGAVRAADVERTRIERDLHDGVQPRLVSVGMTLGLAQQQIDEDPVAAKQLIAEAHTSTKAAITELRQLARGIHASVLDDRGLDAALSALAARSHIPVHLDVRVTGRCSRDVEAAVYFTIAESLTNAAKHSKASECRVVVRLRNATGTGDGPGDGGGTEGGAELWARVEDNGIGGATVTPGGGLDGVMNRVLAAGGTARLESPQGGPTSLEVSIPCAS